MLSRAGRDGRMLVGCWIVGLGLLALMGLAACAPSQNGGSPGKPQACGTVQVRGNGQVVDTTKAQQAENCFWQAYQQCQAATIIVTTMGVDSGINRTFTVIPKDGGCKVSDAEQSYVVPNHTGPLNTYTCASVQQLSNGLLFHSCGVDGDVQVPPQPGNA
jgi:hypothetical protein